MKIVVIGIEFNNYISSNKLYFVTKIKVDKETILRGH